MAGNFSGGNQNSVENLLNQAIAAHEAGDLAAAESLCDLVLKQDKRQFDALHLLGVVKAVRGEFAAALIVLERALKANGRSSEAHTNHGRVLNELHRHDDALLSYERALALSPGHLLALLNRGSTLLVLNRPAEALDAFDRVLSIQPDVPSALYHRSVALNDLRRHEEALAACDRVLAVAPDYPEALHHRGLTLTWLGRDAEAIDSFEQALRLKPDFAYVRGDLLHARLKCCQWADLEKDVARIVADIRAGKSADWPFSFLAISDTPRDQLLCSRFFVADKCPPAAVPIWRGERYRHDRIRVAYLSSDFHQHATAYLTAGLFEKHDRSRFEVTALSFGANAPNPMRDRLISAFEHFTDVSSHSDRQIADLIRRGEIDIAIDLKGFTLRSRPGIFARRAAPIQVNYLGFPGTMAAPYMDYILADRVVIPPDEHGHYQEKVVYLPHSYQANDSNRAISDRTPSRAECGLPDGGFVFCCFNNSYKLTPRLFDVWMRLLRAVDGSVLWLFEANGKMRENLRAEAERRGVAADRLVFAKQTNLENHLARYRLADLVLDTLPYGAHTTASDALWAGTPIVACSGTSFAGRVSASLLGAIELPELITNSLDEYEALALKLAQDRMLLTEIKAKLAGKRATAPLFNTDLFCRHVEAAFTQMWERYQRGKRPESFSV